MGLEIVFATVGGVNMFNNEYKKAKNLAEQICFLTKNNFLEDLSYPIELEKKEICNWYQLKGFRVPKGREATKEMLLRGLSSWVRGPVCRCFMVTKENGKFAVYYGSRDADVTSFEATLPDCDLKMADIKIVMGNFNGVFTGTIKASQLAEMFAFSDIANGYVATLISPVEATEIQDKISEIIEKISYFNNYKHVKRNYGNQSKRVEEIPIKVVENAICALTQEKEYLEKNLGDGFVNVVVKFGGATMQEFKKIASILRSCVEYDENSGFEPARIFFLGDSFNTIEEITALPYVNISRHGISAKFAVLTLQNVKNVASFCLPPLNSYNGYYLKNYCIEEDSLFAFPIPETIQEESIVVGRLINSEIEARIPLKLLNRHTLITGVTGTGKTTTVKRILLEAKKNNIPFLVFEAAKKEYINMLSNVLDLKVYTAGTDGEPLGFNPLAVENGVLIETHIKAVVRAIIAACGGEHPIPQALEGVLKTTYERFGWKYGMVAFNDAYRPFPCFSDVLQDINRYVDEHAVYGAEIKQNIFGALLIRLENMAEGATGKLFNNRQGLMAKDLLEASCIIELDEFSRESAAFVMNILLFKLQCYLSKQPPKDNICRLIVIEEAHNLFKKTLAVGSSQDLNNDYLDKLLNEIRASGTGLIISTTMPSNLSNVALANTAVKICHCVSFSEDKDVIQKANNFSDFQMKVIGELKNGECCISLAGTYGTQHTIVSQVTENRLTGACHICRNREQCRQEEIKNIILNLDRNTIDYYGSKIKFNLYNGIVIPKILETMFKELNIPENTGMRICLLGHMLYDRMSYQEVRFVINTYWQYVKQKEEM